MIFTAKGVGVLKNGAADQVMAKEEGKSIGYFLRQAIDAGVKVVACQQGLDYVGMKKDDLIKEVDEIEIMGAASFVDLVLSADQVLTF